MTQYALVAATLLADDVDQWGMPVLRAVLPVAGMTVIEQQAEHLRSCGVTRMLVHVDAVPATLAQACDRMRARGIDCRLVRCASDVLRNCVDATQMLLVADGLIANAALWRRALAASSPCVLTTADGPMTSSLERIDAGKRWAGLAIVGRALIDQLEGVSDDWDPQLVLFRSALQTGADLIDCDQSLFVSGDVTVAENPAEAAGAESRLIASNASVEWGLAGRWLIAPLFAVAGAMLLSRQDSGKWLRVVTPLAAVTAALAAVMQQPWIMATAGVLAAISHQGAQFIAGFRPESRGWRVLAMIGIASQFLALAIADRGMAIDNPDSWMGSGGLTLSIVLLIGIILHRILPLPGGRLLDLPTGWMLAAMLVPVIGWRSAFDGVGLIAAIVLIAVILRHGSRRDDTPKGAV